MCFLVTMVTVVLSHDHCNESPWLEEIERKFDAHMARINSLEILCRYE